MADLMSGLQAGANFGSGFQQGTQIATQNKAMNAMNQISLEDNQLKLEQDKLAAQQQKALSDRAMQLFNPSTPPPGANPVPPAQTPGGDDSQQGPDLAGKFEQLANSALASGDITHASELAANVANLNANKLGQMQKESAIQTAELKRQQMAHGMTAQLFGGIDPDSPNAEGEFEQAKMQAMSSPFTSPAEAQNIASWKYSPELLKKIEMSGMTSAQQAAQKLREVEFAHKQGVDSLNDQHKQLQDKLRVAHEQAYEQHATTQGKAGAIDKAPTTEELKIAAPIVAEAIGVDPSDPILADVDPKNPKAFTQATPALINIVSQAKQLMRQNKAIATLPQAIAMAAQQSKSIGELGTQIKTEKHFIGADTTTKTATFKTMGNTEQNPIPLPKTKAELIPGKFYTHNGKVEQYTGQ